MLIAIIELVFFNNRFIFKCINMILLKTNNVLFADELKKKPPMVLSMTKLDAEMASRRI